MPSKDIFEKPFDEGTLIKLEIFEKYLERWLPTFIMSKYEKPIQIFDFFAGIGYDRIGQEGSPIRILKVINDFRGDLIKKRKKIFIYLNDIDFNKYYYLKLNVKKKIKELSLNSFVKLKFTNKNFKECFKKYYKKLCNGYNLIFIDQNGFKQVNEKIFQKLIKLETTDFIFFISSSYIHRFAISPNVQKIHPKFDFERIKNAYRKKVHNIICEEYKKYIPADILNCYLIPFSIIKSDNNNVYGLIFVCKHIFAADKFLNIVWDISKINGNANFDIDDDLTKSQLHLFNGKIPTKIEKFKYDLREKILNGEIKNNKQAYIFTVNHGHISKHANEEIKKLKKENLINYESKSPLVNYKQAIKDKHIIEYKIIK